MTTSMRLLEPRSTASFSPESSLVFQMSRDPAETAAVEGVSAIRGDPVTPVVGADGDWLMRAAAFGAADTNTRKPAKTIVPTISRLSALRDVVYDIRVPLPTETKTVSASVRLYKSFIPIAGFRCLRQRSFLPAVIFLTRNPANAGRISPCRKLSIYNYMERMIRRTSKSV